jgi:DNA-binding CsgD family transcriptional regulator
LGLLCLIPLVGAFVGLRLLLYGLIKYKDKWLSIIGAAGIIWTIVIYSTLFYAGTHASVFKKGFEDIAQMQLNSLVKNIEYYNELLELRILSSFTVDSHRKNLLAKLDVKNTTTLIRLAVEKKLI